MQVVQKLSEAIVREISMLLAAQTPHPNGNEIVGCGISGVTISSIKISRRTSIEHGIPTDRSVPYPESSRNRNRLETVRL
jgi:hypothetical protein